MATPGEDFEGYMEGMKAQEVEHARMQAMYADHELWRQTTWGGWAVRQIEGVGRHLAPFFETLIEAMEAEENTPGRLLISILIKSLMLAGLIVAMYAVARVLNMFLGREIVIEEEVVINHDDEVVPVSRRDKKNK